MCSHSPQPLTLLVILKKELSITFCAGLTLGRSPKSKDITGNGSPLDNVYTLQYIKFSPLSGDLSTCVSERFWKVSYSPEVYVQPSVSLHYSALLNENLSESWVHREVTDWHVGWHHSNVSIPRRKALFNCTKVSCDEWAHHPGSYFYTSSSL